MGYFGCGAMIQFSVIGLVTIASMCSLYAWYGDYLWADELQRIKAIFTDEELELLERNGQFWDIPYLGALGGLYILTILHTVLCFLRQHSRFHKSKLSLMMTVVIGLGLIVVSACPVITAWVYDANYYKVQEHDRRTYSYQTELFNGSSISVKTNSIFHYCHFGNGRPLQWSRLKGIRMKKFGSNICQKVGFRYISAFLTLYAGLVYLLTLKVLDSRHRDKSAAHIALLFDLFGDLEESITEYNATRAAQAEDDEHFGLHMDMQAYKRELLKNTYQNTKLPPKLEEWLRTGKYEEEDDAAYDMGILEPNRYHVSEDLEEDAARGIPGYLTNIMAARLETAGEAEAKEKAKRENKEIVDQRKEEWIEARKQRLRAKRIRYAEESGKRD